jgi:protein-L-isoaspartate(D-aspartate) O-methyltransferase
MGAFAMNLRKSLFTLLLLLLTACTVSPEATTPPLTNTPESLSTAEVTTVAVSSPTLQPTEFIMTPEALDRTFEDSEQMREWRNQLVDLYIVPVVSDERVLEAMRAVPRHSFIPSDVLSQAYNDHPLPIGYGQTISQPSLVAMMTELLQLEEGDRVLEIGTGSGYQAAILRELTSEVYSVEIIPELAGSARAVLDALGYADIHLDRRDGYYGWSEFAPFDAIIVTAAPDHLPTPLVEQLNPDGGRMVIPIGPVGDVQTLWLVTRQGEDVQMERLLDVRFVPFTRDE